MNLMVFGMALPWLLSGFGCWLFVQFLRQNGRLLLRLEAMEGYLDRMADAQQEQYKIPLKGSRPLSESRLNRDGLPKGTPAPDFRLPRLDGGELSLSEYRGRKVLLVFSDPHCGPCDAVAPELEQAYREWPDVQVLMVSRGEAGENRQKVKRHKLTFPIVLQRKWEISQLYALFATSVGYLIDAEGLTTSDVAIGADSAQAAVSL